MWKRNEDEDVISTSGTSSTSSTSTRTASAALGSAHATRSVIGANSTITGDISANEDILVEGTLNGAIVCQSNTVTIGRSGKVIGNINAETINVEGTVEGEVKASDRLILKDTSTVNGNISAVRLVMDDGCSFQGGVEMVSSSTPSFSSSSSTSSSSNSTSSSSSSSTLSGSSSTTKSS